MTTSISKNEIVCTYEREAKMELVREFLKENGASFRSAVCEKFDMSWTSAYDVLKSLEMRHIVKRVPVEPDGKRGRPKVLWSCVEDAKNENVHNIV